MGVPGEGYGLMSALLKVAVLILCLNIFAYIGSAYIVNSSPGHTGAVRVPHDLFDYLMGNPDAYYGNLSLYSDSLAAGTNFSGYTSNELSANISSLPNQQSGITSVFGISWLDVAKIVWGVFALLINFVITPITIMSLTGMPPFLVMFVGVPLALLMFLGVMAFIRGGAP